MWKVLLVHLSLIAIGLGGPALDSAFSRDILRGGRIAGGTEAQRNQFPYQVAIFVYLPTAQSFCSGSILSANFVLSAAHCFYGFESADLLAGVHDIVNDYTGWEMEVFPNDIIRHAQHNRQTNLNDIALVRTSRKPIIFNATLQTIPLIARSYASTDLTNTMARIAGWGLTSDSSASSISDRLMFIDQPIISNAVCTQTFGSYITPSNLCISGANGRSTCPGDSGGPLTITLGGRQVQVGIVSFGSERGCQVGSPQAFARITSFHDWIQQNSGIIIY